MSKAIRKWRHFPSDGASYHKKLFMTPAGQVYHFHLGELWKLLINKIPSTIISFIFYSISHLIQNIHIEYHHLPVLQHRHYRTETDLK